MLHAAQTVWCCRAPGSAPIQPDVKTIQITREFPYLPSESEWRLSPALSLSLRLFLSLSFSLSVRLYFPCLQHLFHGGQARTHTAIGVPGMSSYCSAKRAVWENRKSDTTSAHTHIKISIIEPSTTMQKKWKFFIKANAAAKERVQLSSAWIEINRWPKNDNNYCWK